MSLASSYKPPIILPTVGTSLPRTQHDWASHLTGLQQWAGVLQDGKFIAPQLINSWSYYGAPYNLPGYRVDLSGRVFLRGLIQAASQTLPSTMFTLPWSPQFKQILMALASTGSALTQARLDVDTSGNVIVDAFVSGVNGAGWVSLDGLSFSLAP